MPKSTDCLSDVPFRNAKASLRLGEAGVRELNPAAGEVLEHARASVHLEPKAMASDMGISHSLVLRGLKSADDLGFHRLWQLSDAYWWELVLAITQKRQLAKTTISLERIA